MGSIKLRRPLADLVIQRLTLSIHEDTTGWDNLAHRYDSGFLRYGGPTQPLDIKLLTKANKRDSQEPFRFLDLPLEIRCMVYENVLSDREIRLPQVKVDSLDHKFPTLTWSWEEFQAQEERDIAITFVSRQVHNESKVFIYKGATIFQSAQHSIQIPEPCRREAIKLVYEYTKFDAPMVPIRDKFSSLKEVIIQWKAERYVGYPVVHLHWGTVLETYTPPGYCEFCVLGVTQNLYHQWLNCWPRRVQTKRREMVGNAKVLLMVSLEEVSRSLVCKERVFVIDLRKAKIISASPVVKYPSC